MPRVSLLSVAKLLTDFLVQVTLVSAGCCIHSLSPRVSVGCCWASLLLRVSLLSLMGCCVC